MYFSIIVLKRFDTTVKRSDCEDEGEKAIGADLAKAIGGTCILYALHTTLSSKLHCGQISNKSTTRGQQQWEVHM